MSAGLMVRQSRHRSSAARAVVRAAIVVILSHGASLALAQRTPVSPDHPWHGLAEKSIEADARNLSELRLNFDPEKIYSLPELIDLAEPQHRELLRRLARPTCLLVLKSP